MSVVKTIAEKLHLSPSTVSLVLNNKPGISAATRQRVFHTLNELGYQDYVPRSTVKPRLSIHFILYRKHGKILSDTPFFAEVMEGIESQTRKYGYNLAISYINGNENIESQLQNISAANCQGIILLATELFKEDLTPFLRLEIPLVVLDSYNETMRVNTVVINNVQGAFEATKYLIDCGHRRIGYLHSKTKINNFLERKEGFKKALKSASIPYSAEMIYRLDANLDGSYRDMAKILSESPKLPTAFFCDNDILCIGAAKALKEAHYAIPDDISMIGFDDIPSCQMLEPPLTTVRVPKQSLGVLAVDRLAQMIHETVRVNVKIEVETSLVERESVKRMPEPASAASEPKK